eukprot:TRINITY_DN17361_c1_g1_i10.p3 TRINITY_DN17361_c1_g1~~TRINITY_DN17361_c1_g1_i10.p3  ORF type:complete len:159 (-),score=42.27 TRINITY_DN17361_c1_g1_i10:176-652(-)
MASFNKHHHEHDSERLPEDVRGVADQLRALPVDAPDGLEDRVYQASVQALRDGRSRRTGVLARIGPVKWMAPIAAAAAVGLLAWAGASWMSPATTPTDQPNVVSTVALDEHVDAALEYADLFADAAWTETLAEEAESLDDAWEPTVESWSLDGEMGAG